MAAEIFHADRRADMTKLIVAFCNSAKAPKTNNRFIPHKIHLVYISYLVLELTEFRTWFTAYANAVKHKQMKWAAKSR
jgi:hypothetical protein